jgi:hypothetical protein
VKVFVVLAIVAAVAMILRSRNRVEVWHVAAEGP